MSDARNSTKKGGAKARKTAARTAALRRTGRSVNPRGSLRNSHGQDQLSVPSSIAVMLRQKILSGELPGGARITESRISRDFRVGQPSVREALFILERQGLVERVANLGTFVRELDVRDVNELYQIRRKLEGLAFELAARQASEEQIAALRALVENMKQAALKKEKRGFFEGDLAFHRRVWELTGNRHLVEVLEQIVVPLFAFSFLRVERGTSELSESAEGHVALVEALSKGPEEAREMSEKWVETFLQRYLSRVLSGSASAYRF